MKIIYKFLTMRFAPFTRSIEGTQINFWHNLGLYTTLLKFSLFFIINNFIIKIIMIQFFARLVVNAAIVFDSEEVGVFGIFRTNIFHTLVNHLVKPFILLLNFLYFILVLTFELPIFLL